MLNTPIAVILTLYGLLYVAVIPFLRWQPWKLLIAAGVLALAAPALLALLAALTLHPYGPGVSLVLYGSYPITAWLAFVLGRHGARAACTSRGSSTAAIALGVGVVLRWSGYGLGAGRQARRARASSLDGGTGVGVQRLGAPTRQALAAARSAGRGARRDLRGRPAHAAGRPRSSAPAASRSPSIALCLLLSRPLRWLLLPLGALGSMPLTAYSAARGRRSS